MLLVATSFESRKNPATMLLSESPATNFSAISKINIRLLDEYLKVKSSNVNVTILIETTFEGQTLKVEQEEQDGKPILKFSYGSRAEITENMTLDLWACLFIRELRNPDNAKDLDELKIDMPTIPDGSSVSQLKCIMNFNGVDFTKVNYDFSGKFVRHWFANLKNTNFSDFKFIVGDFFMANFEGAIIRLCVFSETNLSRAVFRNVTFGYTMFLRLSLAHACFVGATVCGVYMEKVVINGANFTGAIFNGNEVITLDLPSKWNLNELESVLGHLSNVDGTSVLTAIDSIDNKYSYIKFNLMKQVIDSLKQTDISSVRNSFQNIFKNSIYSRDTTIKSFIDKVEAEADQSQSSPHSLQSSCDGLPI